MPYISKMSRLSIEDGHSPHSPGELNYVFTKNITRYLKENDLSYMTINDILGAFEGAKLEFYRRVVVPYEEEKCKENGDVYSTPSDREEVKIECLFCNSTGWYSKAPDPAKICKACNGRGYTIMLVWKG